MSCSNTPPSSAFISPEYLAELHDMEIEEAEMYYRFCRSKTMRYKECYGNGSIMLPQWIDANLEAIKTVHNLLTLEP